MSTTIDSPDPLPELTRRRERKEGYRPPCKIPVGLRDTLKIVLEEELYIPGLDLLQSLITQGLSSGSHDQTDTTTPTTPSTTTKTSPSTPPLPIYIPPSAHLRLCTTILAHPSFTTHISKKKDRDAGLVPPLAERLLRRLLVLAGPDGMGLSEAWGGFGSSSSIPNINHYNSNEILPRTTRAGSLPPTSLSTTSGGGGNSPTDPSAIFEDNKLDLGIAKRDGLFERAEDFWHLVGWGLTCACWETAEVGSGEEEEVEREKRRGMERRWGAWRRVLRLMVEGLERDWEDRSVFDGAAGEATGGGGNSGCNGGNGNGNGCAAPKAVKLSKEEESAEIKKQQRNSLIVKYLPSSTGNIAFRRVFKAIFADGKGKAGQEWREIWRDELFSLKTIRARKRGGGGGKKPLATVVEAPRKAGRKPGRKAGVGNGNGEGDREEKREVKKKSILDESSSEEDDDEEEESLEEDGGKGGEGEGEGDEMKDVEYDEDEHKPKDATVKWGGMEALLLRQRLLVLISDVAKHGFFCTTEKFFDELKDYILPLPLSDFLLFTNPCMHPSPTISPPSFSSPSTSIIATTPPSNPQSITPTVYAYQTSLLLTLMHSLITSDSPDPTSMGYSYDDINPELLVTCYLPFAAKTTSLADNTKMAVVLQVLVRVMARGIGLRGWPEMVGAMEDGVEKRREKVDAGGSGKRSGGKKGKGGKEEGDRGTWEAVERRLRGVVEVLCLVD